MKHLINFLIKNSVWFVAVVLLTISFYLVFKDNPYQRSVYLSSANRVTGWFYSTSQQISSFFYFRKNNEELSRWNEMLQNELYRLKSYLDVAVEDSLSTPPYHTQAFDLDSVSRSRFTFIAAEVVNLTISGANNFITLNKGTNDGVKPDMGVISQSGIVGVVSSVSKHLSVVIPVIHPKFRLSAKLKQSQNHGSISWNGKDIRCVQLGELPKHETFVKGDTVLSSFSRIFPKNLIIGVVTEPVRSKNDFFNSYNVALSTDFHSLHNVLIIRDKLFEEQQTLEQAIQS